MAASPRIEDLRPEARDHRERHDRLHALRHQVREVAEEVGLSFEDALEEA